MTALALALLQLGIVAAENGRSSVSGTITSEPGNKPVAGAELRLTLGTKTETRKTGTDGKYIFNDLEPGKYTVRVTPPTGFKPKGEGVANGTIEAGDSDRVDFVLVAGTVATPTPQATPSPTVAQSPTSQSNHTGTQSSGSTTQGSTQSSGIASLLSPSLVAPVGSPQPANRTNQTTSVIQTTASPGPLAFAAPPLLVAASPTPQNGPQPADAPSPEDALAAGPPRRLITSFSALRATASGSNTTAELKSWATETSLVLGVPFRTQIDGTAFSLVNCGPASLSMVLTAFGLDVDPPSVRDYLNFLVGNFDTEQGTSLYVLARIAQEAGLTTFGTNAGLQGWTVDQVRDQLRAGHPVITLTKYRRLPGHFGSVTEFDHYIVLTGLAGDDFVYNDAAYATEYGYNLLISPAQLERAWADSSVPRHALAVGYGSSLKPLPIVPRRLTAESLSVPRDLIMAPPEAVVRPVRGVAAERLREEMLDRLGARTAVVDGEPTDPYALAAPQTRLDAAETASRARAEQAASTADPAALRVPEGREEVVRGVADSDGVMPWDAIPATDTAPVEAVANARDPAAAPSDTAVFAPRRLSPSRAEEPASAPFSLDPIGIGLLGLGLMLAVGGRMAGWRRRDVTPLMGRLKPAAVTVLSPLADSLSRLRLPRVHRRSGR